MQVFKSYFRIIRACLPSLLVYLVVFLGIAVITSRFYSPPTSTDFTETRTKITVINRDGNTPLTQGLIDYLAKSNTLVELPDDREKLQDALFFRNVEYIAIIPSGFTADFEAGGSKAIETVVVPDSTSARYIDLLVDKYLSATHLIQSYGGLTPDQRVQAVKESLAVKTEVQVVGKATSSNSQAYFSYYYTYLAYALISLIMLGISTIMMVYNQPDLRRRNLCAPLKQRSMNLQLALGSVVYSIGSWVLMNGFGILIYGKAVLSSGLLPYLALNSLTFTIVCTAIGFLAGILIKSYNVQAAVANVLSLSMSFLCGVFVPQAVMSKAVLRFSSFLPAYWYVKANDAIGASTIDFKTVLMPILIQLGFAVAIFSVALFLGKQRRLATQ